MRRSKRSARPRPQRGRRRYRRDLGSDCETEGRRGEEIAEISTSICSAPTLGISLSALEFNEWSRSMAKVDTDKIDNDIARERKNAQLPAGEELT